MICKNCHQEISNQPIYIKEEELLCKQCKRDEALNDVLNKKPNLKKKLNIVYSKNWMKWFLGIIGTSLLIQMFGLFFGIKFFSFLGGILTFTGQLLNYLNFLHYSIKKDPIK